MRIIVNDFEFNFFTKAQLEIWIQKRFLSLRIFRLLSSSLLLAYIYMEYFKEMALGSTSLKPSMWLRYVDDTFILCLHQENVQILLDHLNSIWQSIQFTMEKEQDNKLPFLNVLVTCTEQRFRSSVYYKPTFTGQYSNFNSHHPYTVKKGIGKKNNKDEDNSLKTLNDKNQASSQKFRQQKRFFSYIYIYIYISSKSSCTIMFTFRLIPLGKVCNPFPPALG